MTSRLSPATNKADARISVVLNTYNAEKHLRMVLESVKDFDEIVVCDMESTDSTRDIAAEYGAKIVIFPRGEHTICEPARDFAIHSASNEWVLVIDADELVTPELREYLYAHIHSGATDTIRIGRRNRFMGDFFTNTPDYQTRFFRQSTTTWPPVIHSLPVTTDRISKVPANRKDLFLVHLDDPWMSAKFAKMNRYTDQEVPRRINSKRYGIIKLMVKPVWTFLRTLFIDGSIRDGRRGLLKAYNSVVYQIMLMSKVTEYQIRKPEDEK